MIDKANEKDADNQADALITKLVHFVKSFVILVIKIYLFGVTSSGRDCEKWNALRKELISEEFLGIKIFLQGDKKFSIYFRLFKRINTFLIKRL